MTFFRNSIFPQVIKVNEAIKVDPNPVTLVPYKKAECRQRPAQEEGQVKMKQGLGRHL